MSTSIPQAFGKHFSAEVHEAYQRMGSKLRNMVRTRSNIKGSSTVFYRVGSGQASTKSRHGKVPVMDINHTPIDCLLSDYYAGDWVDKLDEIKVSFEERQVIAHAGAYALGRKTDALIIEALDDNNKSSEQIVSGNSALSDSSPLTKEKILAGLKILGKNNVPDDGQRCALIGWSQWAHLLDIDEFKDARYVGKDELPWQGTQGKRWLGTLWIPHSGLTQKSNYRICHWFHKTAIGHASGQDITTDITWHGDRAAYFVSNMMSQGACLIDPKGSVVLRCADGNTT